MAAPRTVWWRLGLIVGVLVLAGCSSGSASATSSNGTAQGGSLNRPTGTSLVAPDRNSGGSFRLCASGDVTVTIRPNADPYPRGSPVTFHVYIVDQADPGCAIEPGNCGHFVQLTVSTSGGQLVWTFPPPAEPCPPPLPGTDTLLHLQPNVSVLQDADWDGRICPSGACVSSSAPTAAPGGYVAEGGTSTFAAPAASFTITG
jgi:hypothetical protein